MPNAGRGHGTRRISSYPATQASAVSITTIGISTGSGKRSRASSCANTTMAVWWDDVAGEDRLGEGAAPRAFRGQQVAIGEARRSDDPGPLFAAIDEGHHDLEVERGRQVLIMPGVRRAH